MNLFADIKPRYERKYLLSIVWALVLGADFIFASFFFAGVRNVHRYVDNSFNADLIREFVSLKEEADLSVVLFGNSRLRYAVPFGVDPLKTVTLPDGRKMVVLQFALNAAHFGLYDVDVSYRVLKSNPDLIIVQDSIISNAPSEIKKVTVYSQTVFEYLRTTFKGISPYQEWWNDRVDVFDDSECSPEYTPETLERQLRFNAARDHHILGDENEGYKAAQRFFVQARAAGIKLAVLRIPPNMPALESLGEPAHKIDFYGIGHMPTLAELLPEEHDSVVWINDPLEIEKEDYCDYVHMNSKGRKVFSSWLLQQIARRY